MHARPAAPCFERLPPTGGIGRSERRRAEFTYRHSLEWRARERCAAKDPPVKLTKKNPKSNRRDTARGSAKSKTSGSAALTFSPQLKRNTARSRSTSNGGGGDGDRSDDGHSSDRERPAAAAANATAAVDLAPRRRQRAHSTATTRRPERPLDRGSEPARGRAGSAGSRPLVVAAVVRRRVVGHDLDRRVDVDLDRDRPASRQRVVGDPRHTRLPCRRGLRNAVPSGLNRGDAALGRGHDERSRIPPHLVRLLAERYDLDGDGSHQSTGRGFVFRRAVHFPSAGGRQAFVSSPSQRRPFPP